MSDEPPFLPVGTEISAKFKGAFCEAKVKKIVKNVKCKVSFKDVQGGSAVLDESAVKGPIRVGALVDVTHPDTKQLVSAVVQNVKDCSTYTVEFDDGDQRVLRRTQMCLKGGKHFHASESLDVMPLTKPEQFGAPVLGRRKGGRRRRAAATTATTATMGTASDTTSSSDEDEIDPTSSTRCADIDDPASGAESESKRSRAQSSPYVGSQSSDYGRVVCVYEQAATSDSRRWFPALIVSPDMRKNLKINTNEEYLVRSFKDGKCSVVQKKRVKDFNLSKGKKVELPSIKLAVEKAIQYLEKDELPPHWDREMLLGERSAADYDEAMMERMSSPGSASSSADVSPSPRSAVGDWPKRGREEGGSVTAEKSEESETGSEQEEEKSNESDSDDRRSPEVGGRTAKDAPGSSSEKQPRKLPRSRHTSGLSQRSATSAKRRVPHQQARRKAGAAMVSSEKKDRFVAQLYKFMDERGTPINKAPVLAGKELDLYQFYDTVKKLGGYNRVCHKGEWKTVIKKMKLAGATVTAVKNAYNKYLFSFDTFYRKLGCALSDVTTPAGVGRVSRRERHASKSGVKPPTTTEGPAESSRRHASVSKTSSTSKEQTTKPQKSSSSAAVVSKSISADVAPGRDSPKVSESREASKERSPSPPPAPPHPPIGDEELVVGARVKVHYGSGSHRKLYQAKIVKVEADNRYVVHYLGWNTRYDEAVPKSRIVEVLSAITAASSDSGVSNNDQGENGSSLGMQKMIRSRSRGHAVEKSPFWRRRRSSGGSTHSLPIGMTPNEEGTPGRKTSSISTTQWRKTEPTAAATAEEEAGESSGKESGAVLSTYKPKQPQTSQTLAVEGAAQGHSMKRPSSANASSEPRERMEESAAAADSASPPKRGRKVTNSGTTTSAAKRKRSLDESEDEEETKSNAGGNSRRVSKRLRGVKASIEEELQKQHGDVQSDIEEEKSQSASATVSTTIVKVELEESTATVAVASAMETVQPETVTQTGTASPALKDSEEKTGEEKASAIVEDRSVDGEPKAETEENQAKTEAIAKDLSPTREVEVKKEPPTTPVAHASSTATGPQKARAAKMRRRRRNYSQMVTDHRSRSTANKGSKRDADSDNEMGGHGGSNGGTSGARHHESSPRDPNSLQALRHRIQAEMDADTSKFKSNFTFNVIDESLDSERKIQVMQSHITELKDTYLRIRAELTQWEKCRKKLLEKKRKQERHAIKASKRASATTSTDGSKKHTSIDNTPSVSGQVPSVKAEEGGET